MECAAGVLTNLATYDKCRIELATASGVQLFVNLARFITNMKVYNNSDVDTGRFVAMLRDSSHVLRTCAAVEILQFTMPGGRHTVHHASLLEKAGAGRVLRATAAAATTPIQAKVFAWIVFEVFASIVLLALPPEVEMSNCSISRKHPLLQRFHVFQFAGRSFSFDSIVLHMISAGCAEIMVLKVNIK